MTVIKHIVFHTVSLLISGSYGLSFAASQSNTTAWVIRWDIDSPSEISDICSEAKDNFANLLVQVRGRADAYYASKIAPRAEDLKNQPDHFDPLATILRKCSAHSIQAWLNVFYLWTGETLPEDPLHPAQQGKSWIIQDNNGRSVSEYSPLELAQGWIEGIYADPSSSAYRGYFVEIVKELIDKYTVKGIHLDFVRYPGLSYGYGNGLAQRYTQQWGFDPRWLPDDVSHNDIVQWLNGTMKKEDQILTTGTILWSAMRAVEVTKMVRSIHTVLKKSDQKIILSAAVFPDTLTAFITKGQDWQQWAIEGLVDQLYPMAYFGEKERVSKQLWSVASALEKTDISVWAGLGAYIKNAEDIKKESLSISASPYDGIALFSLGHLLKKKGRTTPYIQALSDFHQTDINIPLSDLITKTSTVPLDLSAIISAIRSLNEENENPSDTLQQIIGLRKQEFAEASRTVVLKSIKEITKYKHTLLPWVDLRGIFRYLHPYDSFEKKEEQKELCKKARDMIDSGTNPVKVAKRYSQAGSRQLGAQLPRYYLSQNKKIDSELGQLRVGAISSVIQQDDGFWAYQIVGKGKDEPEFFSDIPWPARRMMLRQQLVLHLTNKK